MEQESKSMEIQRYAFRDAEGAYVRYADHLTALKAAQDAIAVEHRALLAANAELRKDAERMRVMREALEVAAIGVEKSDMSRVPSLVRAWIHEAKMKRRAALASTAPVAEAGQKEGE